MSLVRRLIVMRHAKSAWDTDAATDHARPLSKRGRGDAPRVGARLAELDWVPELVISSDSRRTQETWARVEPAFEVQIPVEFTRSLYGAGIGDVQRVVAQVPPSVHTLAVLGHNPCSESLVQWLTDEPETITTANAALMQIEAATWEQAIADRGAWTLVEVIRPREI